MPGKGVWGAGGGAAGCSGRCGKPPPSPPSVAKATPWDFRKRVLGQKDRKKSLVLLLIRGGSWVQEIAAANGGRLVRFVLSQHPTPAAPADRAAARLPRSQPADGQVLFEVVSKGEERNCQQQTRGIQSRSSALASHADQAGIKRKPHAGCRPSADWRGCELHEVNSAASFYLFFKKTKGDA